MDEGCGCGVVVVVLVWLAVLPLAVVNYQADTAFARRAVTTKAYVESSARGSGSGDTSDNGLGWAKVMFSTPKGPREATVNLDGGAPRPGEHLTIGYDPHDPSFAVSPPPTRWEMGPFVLGVIGLPPWLGLIGFLGWLLKEGLEDLAMSNRRRTRRNRTTL